MIVGQEKPDSGELQDRRDGQDQLRRPEPRRPRPDEERLGARVRRAGLHQGRQRRDAVAGLRRRVRLQGPGPAEAGRSVLSGGERNRLNLALTLKEGGNVLMLDEPTNDLDVETLGSLENALLEFPGCAVITSPRPVVPRPHRDAHPGLGGHADEPGASGSGSRATSSPTRRTRSSASAPTPPGRTPSPTASSPATDASHGALRARGAHAVVGHGRLPPHQQHRLPRPTSSRPGWRCSSTATTGSPAAR